MVVQGTGAGGGVVESWFSTTDRFRGVLEDLEKPYAVPSSVHDGHARLEGPWAVHGSTKPPSGA